MSKIGCHVSIAGGIFNAPKNAGDLGCEIFQIFSRSPQGGPAPKLTPDIVKQFKEEMKKNGQENCYIHTPYYINFCSPKKNIAYGSISVVRDELERGSLIGAKYIMTHLGSGKDMERGVGVQAILKGVQKVLDGYKGSTQLLLEISAGTGNIMGDTFEELALIINKDDRIGVCLDTCHMFAGGYDITNEAGLKKTISIIKNTVGLDSIKLVHANDSKFGLGEHKDRHDHIGDGKIGKDAFKLMMKAFPKLDFILETEHDKVKEDIKTLKTIRKGVLG
jgi:deoxyribonuclease-4